MQMAYGWIYLHLARPWIVLRSSAFRLPPVAFLSLTFGRRPDLAVFWYIFLWPNLMGNSKRVKQVHTHTHTHTRG